MSDGSSANTFGLRSHLRHAKGVHDSGDELSDGTGSSLGDDHKREQPQFVVDCRETERLEQSSSLLVFDTGVSLKSKYRDGFLAVAEPTCAICQSPAGLA